MSLPVMSVPTYEVKLQSFAKPIKYRPYLVKEEKILLMAQQGNDPKEIELAVKQIIRNCTNDAFDVDSLASFDLEYLFLKLRAKSVNNVIELRYNCQNSTVGSAGPTKCQTTVPISVNLDDIKVVVPEGHTKKIMLTDDVGVTLKYPTVETANELLNGETVDIVHAIELCLETIFMSNGTVYEIEEIDPKEVTTFIESLSIPQVDRIRQFFETMPTLSHTIVFKCPKCGYTEDIVLSGLQDFFG